MPLPEIPVHPSRVEEKPSPEPRDPLNLYFLVYLAAGQLSTGMAATRAEGACGHLRRSTLPVPGLSSPVPGLSSSVPGLR